MQNLDQIRAAAALAATGDNSLITRQAVSKLPAMILQNGLLAAIAFATETKDNGNPKRPEMLAAVDATADHLANPQLGITILAGKNTASSLTRALSSQQASNADLERAATGALAFLAFVKRYAIREETAI